MKRGSNEMLILLRGVGVVVVAAVVVVVRGHNVDVFLMPFKKGNNPTGGENAAFGLRPRSPLSVI